MRRSPFARIAALCLLACLFVSLRSLVILAADVPVNLPTQGQLDTTYDQQLKPLLTKYCTDCHSGKKPEGNFNLDPYGSAGVRAKARLAWAKTLRKVRDNEMPPKDSDPLSAAERAKIVEWCQSQIRVIDATQPIDPGRVTMRRLNRVEYNNTIRDLCGVDFKPAEDFPSDDVGYGFDNIGDVLWLPPLLMEKYLAAAEKILERAIVVHDPNQVTSKRQEAKQFGKKTEFGQYHPDRKVYGFFSNGEIETEFDFASGGDYAIFLRAWGDQAGDEPCKMVVRLDGKQVYEFQVRALERRPITYETKVSVEKGRHKLGIAFTNDYFKEATKDTPAHDRNLYVEYLEIKGKFSTEAPTLPESHKRIIVANAKQMGRAEAARKIIENFASHAFRRAVRPEEIDRLVKLWTSVDKSSEPLEKSIRVPLQAILVSPHFLFRVEADAPGAKDAPARINDFELAVRLSYFLWSSMPDDTLLSLAFNGKLRENLQPQVRRMLADPKAQALTENFAGQWLQTRRLRGLQPDTKKFPQFDEKLRTAMIQETELFFAGIVREDRSVLEFVDADYTYLNEKLAQHYGIAGVTGDEFRKVTLSKDSARGGIITQASILTATSNPTRTSPVKRGKWVLENLLAVSPPPAPEVLDLPDDRGEALKGTLRQRLEQHRQNPNCYSCHQQLDPPGFGLENFDAIGKYRTKDGDDPIDASGELPGGKAFNGPQELKKLLKQQGDLFCRCLAERMLTYALGRGLEDYDDRTLDRIVRKMAENDYRFSALVLEIVNCEPFQMKRGPGAKK